MSIELDNTPLPDDGKVGTPKYPWRKMEVGKSFFVPSVVPKRVRRALQNFRSSTGETGSASRFKGSFVIRDAEEDSVVGTRVWRVK